METEDTPAQYRDEFTELIARVRQGDDLAAQELVQRYERAVLRSVRTRLGKNMRSTLDSMDIVQSVYRSLLFGLRDKKYQFSEPHDLIALAVIMVQRKVARHWRKLKHFPSGYGETHSEERDTSVDRIASRDPTVSHVESANELLNQFLSQLDEFDQQLVHHKLNGYSSVETARLLDREPAYIRMRWTRLRKTLRDSGYSGG